MTYNLYIDVVFLTNFFMDFLLLLILRVVLKYPKKWLRMIISSGIGATYGLLIIMFPVLPRWFEMFLTYGLISALMVKIAFAPRTLRELAKGVLGLYLSAFFVAGMGYLWRDHVSANAYIERLIFGNGYKALPVMAWFFFMTGTYFIIKYIWLQIESEKKFRNHLYRVILRNKGKSRELTALLDTGNQLFEPISKKPVHVVSYEALGEICQEVSGIFMIPYQAVGTRSGMLPAIKIDEMDIIQGEFFRQIKDPLIGLSKEGLSFENTYQMLLHQKILEE